MEYLSVKKASELIGVSKKTVIQYIKMGKLKAKKEEKGRHDYKIFEEVLTEEKLSELKESKERYALLQKKEVLTTNALEELKGMIRELLELQRNTLAELHLISQRLEQQNTTTQNETENNPITQSKTESIDFPSLRDLLIKEVERRGGNRTLARLVGISESVIRRFIKGECKTLSVENVAKIKQTVKSE